MRPETRQWLEAMKGLIEDVLDEVVTMEALDSACNALVQVDLRPNREFVTVDEGLNEVKISTVDFASALVALISDLEALSSGEAQHGPTFLM